MADNNSKPVDQSPLSALLAWGNVGLSLSTIATVLLFFLGYAHWLGYFSRFHVDIWAIDIPLLRYIVPSELTLLLILIVFVNYISGYWQWRIQTAAKVVNDAEEALISRLGLNSKKYIPYRPQCRAFSDSSSCEPILSTIAKPAQQNPGTGLMTIPDDELMKIGKRPLGERLQLLKETRSLIRKLSRKQFEGLKVLLIVIKAMIASKEDWQGQYARFDAMLAEYRANVEPGKVERRVGCIIGIVYILWLIYAGIYNRPALATSILGGVMGTTLLFAPRHFKGPENKYYVVLFVYLFALGHAYWNGQREGDTRLQYVHVRLKGESQEQPYRHVFETSKGIYVAGQPKGSETSLRLLLDSELESVRYSYAPDMDRLEKDLENLKREVEKRKVEENKRKDY